ncbi:hypothetical protein LHU53_12980 [Rhodoferax sp. U2-2l]|uniref:XopAX family type III secretion system effector n=1 Tax=Rhodoferax sp. U2-2l TaxID=2884000 RepID=UPI001D0B19E5|nr:XopAX family type III secretion system effector [Rhodoferax sp. U2-2l]MCB8747818.1 hypothetical protein [Rhodoferax sp. U2-2l]
MRITNDCQPDAMLAELFRLNKSTVDDTAGFNEVNWSNHDFVCKELKQRVDAMLRSYKRLGNEVNVTQSFRDNGVDILLELESSLGSTRRIGIQVKSNREAIAAVKRLGDGNSMEGVLKRQAFEATKWDLQEWWVVLCFDLTSKAHSDLVNRISSELLPGRPFFETRIFKPTEAWDLLALGDEGIDAICVSMLCKDDEILVAAKVEAEGLTGGAYSVVMNTLFDSFSEHTLLSLGDLSRLTEVDYSLDITATSAVVDELEANGYLTYISHEDAWSTCPTTFPGLCALYFEGRTRHRLSSSAAANFVQKLV